MRLLRAPETARAVLVGFPSNEAAGACVAGVIGSGIIPGGMEMMDKPAIAAAEAFVEAGYPLDVETLLIVELDGHTVMQLRAQRRQGLKVSALKPLRLSPPRIIWVRLAIDNPHTGRVFWGITWVGHQPVAPLTGARNQKIEVAIVIPVPGKKPNHAAGLATGSKLAAAAYQ